MPAPQPRVTGQGPAVPTAQGTYTSIVSMGAWGMIAWTPLLAGPGEYVEVHVHVQNLHTAPIYIAVTALFGSTEFLLFPDQIAIAPGKTEQFIGIFTMPNNNVKVTAWSHYWTGTEWYEDDSQFVDVQLNTALKPQYRNFAISSWTPDPAILREGDELLVIVKVEHAGPAEDIEVRFSIGQRLLIFDEILYELVPLRIPQSGTWETVQIQGYISITSAISPAIRYDLECKLDSPIAGQMLDSRDDIITIEGIGPAEFRLFSIKSYSPSVVAVGNTLTITHEFEHRGAAHTPFIRSSLKILSLEYLFNEVDFPIAEDADWTLYTRTVAISILGKDPLTDIYDLESKMGSIPGPDLFDSRLGAITIVEEPAATEFDNLQVNYKVLKA